MADWGKEYTFDPNIVIVQSASKLTVAVTAPEPAWKISAYLDHEAIGQWVSGEMGSTTFDVDLTRFGPGSHKLRVVRNIDYGLEITEQLITDPHSTGLYFAEIPDVFEPNELYRVRGFNLNEEELNFRIGNVQGETIYDVNVPPGVVELAVPDSILGSNVLATLSIQAVGKEPVAEKDLVRTFQQGDYKNKTVQMVIIAPDKDVFNYRKLSIQACAQACDNRNVSWVVLYHTDVTPANLTYLLHRPTVRYVYWCGHGNSHVGRTPEQEEQNTGGVPRTHMSCWKATPRRWRSDKWETIKALSHTRQTSSMAAALPDDWDLRGFDLWSIGIHDEVNKWIIFIDCCRSAVYDLFDVPDMAQAFGIGNSGNNNQIYIGWRSEITTSMSGKKEIFSPRNFEKYTAKINPAIRRFWEKMGTGSTVQQALEATTEASYLGQDPVLAIWGMNTKMDLTAPHSDDSIRVFGNGLTNKLSNSN